MNYTQYVDLFHGCGLIKLPRPQGIAKGWHFIKALYGNTHPGATLPFGKYSVCPFTAGYASGYGNNLTDPEKCVPNDTSLLRLRGFSHFQQSGTGFIVIFYNYAVTTPFYGEKRLDYGAKDEYARPGYYRVTLEESGILCELTAADDGVLHRYTFDRDGGKIAIDFLNDGLYFPRTRGEAKDLSVNIKSPTELIAEVTLRGIRFSFAVSFEGDGALDENGVFMLNGAGSVVMRLSAVNTGAEDAVNELKRNSADFDSACAAALDKWENALSAIEIESDDVVEKQIFYSNLYHTLVKPAIWKNGGGFLWSDAPFTVDFATMWDIYKTQLPLIYSLYGEASEHITSSILKIAQITGRLPHAFLMADNMNLESGQGRLNAVHTLYDAFIRGVKGDWNKAAKTVINEIDRDVYREFTTDGECARSTHQLDMSQGCAAAADMARWAGLQEDAERLEKLSELWIRAFDPQTGLLWEDREYYEGNHWNYSFRPLRCMEKRIELCGKEKFVQLLDRFFGFTHTDDFSARFEGFNNESDMESPYAYLYVGRQDRLSEIIDTADRCIFRQRDGGTGRGGLPGNNDSGGLSACFIWNTLGLFPVTGQDMIFITKPKFKKSIMHLAGGKDLEIRREGDGNYAKRAVFNGKSCENFTIKASEMMDGGEIVIYT